MVFCCRLHAAFDRLLIVIGVRTDRHAYDLFSVGHLQLPEQPDILESSTVLLDVFFCPIMSS